MYRPLVRVGTFDSKNGLLKLPGFPGIQEKKNNMKIFKWFTVMVVVCTLTVASLAAGDEHPIAEEVFGPGGISFSPITTFKQVVLTISFPSGEVFERTFQSGETPQFSLSDTENIIVTDGLYNYELRLVPFNGGQYREAGEKVSLSTRAPVVQSGYFQVQKGGILPKIEDEPRLEIPAPPVAKQPDVSGTNDVCYADDLVVDGSLCVGFDCTCNMSFGFDTIVLKENNLRIFFDDTSNSGSFPKNDWRILINDTSNGGAQYFGVEDSTAGRRVFTLEAGAPTHSLYVDDGGRVGLGTSTPVVDLHVKSGNTPTLRLDQDGTSGFTPQVWDVAGNETNFFVRDATNGSTLPFKIKPGAPNNALYIDPDGEIGVGTASPSSQVHVVKSGSAATFMVERSDGTAVKTIIKSTGTNGIIGTFSNHDLIFNANNTGRMTLTTAGGISMPVGGGTYNQATGQWVDGSSRAYKEEIEELSLDAAVKAIEKLTPVTFKMKVAEPGEKQVGFIAEDVPELVAQKNRKGLAAMDIVAVLTRVVQDQQKQLKAQQNTISELNKRLSEIEKKK